MNTCVVMFWLYFDPFCHDNILFWPFGLTISKDIAHPVLRTMTADICNTNTFVTVWTQQGVLPRRGWLQSLQSESQSLETYFPNELILCTGLMESYSCQPPWKTTKQTKQNKTAPLKNNKANKTKQNKNKNHKTKQRQKQKQN